MSQIVLIHSNANVRDLLTINLTTYLGVHLIPRANAEEAMALLEILPNIDIIITEAKIESELCAKLLVDFINKHNLKTELVVMGEVDPETKLKMKDWSVVPGVLDWEGAIDAVSKFLGITLEELKKKLTPQYIPVGSDYFYALHSTPCDIFIRIKQGEGQFQYLKRIHRGDHFEVKDIKRYEAQGLKYFFILKEDRDAFATFVSNALVLRLERDIIEAGQQSDPAEQMPVLGESYDLAQRSILEQGLNASTIQLADTVIQGMISTTERSKVLGPLFRQILGLTTGKLFKKGQITLMVALEVLKQKNPAYGLPLSDDAALKIAYAAFFADSRMLDFGDADLVDRLSLVDASDTSVVAALDENIRSRFINHALDAALFIRKNPEAPLDVDIIVKQHHGSSNGSGFKSEYAQLAPLSRLFILSEAFARRFIFYSEQGKTDRPIILDMQEKFAGHPSMELLVKALQESLKQRESRV